MQSVTNEEDIFPDGWTLLVRFRLDFTVSALYFQDLPSGRRFRTHIDRSGWDGFFDEEEEELFPREELGEPRDTLGRACSDAHDAFVLCVPLCKVHGDYAADFWAWAQGAAESGEFVFLEAWEAACGVVSAEPEEGSP